MENPAQSLDDMTSTQEVMQNAAPPARFLALSAWPAVVAARERALDVETMKASLAAAASRAHENEQPLTAVLDTNVVLDLYYWKDAHCEALAQDLAAGRLIAVTSLACLEELADVLSRPHFGLSEGEQLAALQAYAKAARIVAMNASLNPASIECPCPARCRDKDDQKFLDLAYAVGAELLFTKDKLVRRAAKKLARFGLRTLSPADWASF